ncbi:hypothetical protein ACRALDRAFT_208529 [Sodiomyces alcalophilus JCM 7366]|uniref:uncharacterized protein n=1 Tax=Sodiomyces alcalophilus JCM 7366 TaxID=591952 RepID=UPI0039B56DC4
MPSEDVPAISFRPHVNIHHLVHCDGWNIGRLNLNTYDSSNRTPNFPSKYHLDLLTYLTAATSTPLPPTPPGSHRPPSHLPHDPIPSIP